MSNPPHPDDPTPEEREAFREMMRAGRSLVAATARWHQEKTANPPTTNPPKDR